MSIQHSSFNTHHSILIIGTVWPEPNSSAAGSRMLQLIAVFQKFYPKSRITFASAAADSDFMFDITSIGLDKQSIQLNDSSFNEFIKDLQPDIVLFDRFMTEEQYGWRVSETCPDALLLLDTEDLHCLRNARQLAWKNNQSLADIDLTTDIAKREIASIYRCDLSLMISEVEMEMLTNYFKVPKALLMEVPFLLDELTEDNISALPSFEERSHFVFIGNFWHEPNYNATLYLKESIWPLIRKQLPKAELHIYGSYGGQKVEQLHNPKQGFIYKGRAESAFEVIQKAKVLLAPLRFGAGLKGKISDAMICGTPNVTSSIGAEGMYKHLPIPGFISDNPLEFAKKAVLLYSDSSTWKEKQQNGFNIINQLYSKKEIEKMVIQRIEKMRLNLGKHRKNNFTGAMLKHQSLNSTKYLSKWIEEKNK